MSENTPIDASDNEMQFDQAEYNESEPAADLSCVSCKQLIAHDYYQINGAILCETCSTGLKNYLTSGSWLPRFLKACLFGFGAAVAGFAIYFGVLKITGMEIGLISILVGFMVGSAVRKGSNGRGGILYQLTAVFFTYMAICLSYGAMLISEWISGKIANEPQAAAPADPAAAKKPNIADATAKPKPKPNVAANDPQPAPPADAKAVPDLKPNIAEEELTFSAVALGFVALLVIFVALPIAAGISQPISLLIIAFALWEAFKLNRKVPINITGPHSVGVTAYDV